jgi:hypothetical protein
MTTDNSLPFTTTTILSETVAGPLRPIRVEVCRIDSLDGASFSASAHDGEEGFRAPRIWREADALAWAEKAVKTLCKCQERDLAERQRRE